MTRVCPGPRSAGAPRRPAGGGDDWTSKAPGEAVRSQVGDTGQSQVPVGCEGERGMEETKTEAPVTVPHHRLFETTVGVVGQGTGSQLFNVDEIPELGSVHDGRGRIVINGRENPLRAGSVVWIASGDAHKVYADADGALTFLEYFSRGEHETVFLEQACEWRPNPAGVCR